jgi:hypothetical protein
MSSIKWIETITYDSLRFLEDNTPNLSFQSENIGKKILSGTTNVVLEIVLISPWCPFVLHYILTALMTIQILE